MKNIIFDTDIGGDCDDVMALDLLISAHKAGECNLIGVTYSDRSPYAPGCIRAILREHGVENIPVGSRETVPGRGDTYATPVAMLYPDTALIETPDAIGLIRKLLIEYEDVTIVATGSLYNIAKLLESGADEYSVLDGISLVRSRVKEFAIMGGNFSHQSGYMPQPHGILPDGSLQVVWEWNIRLDAEESKYFFENCPVTAVLSPFELGYGMYTGAPMCAHGGKELPDSLAYTVFGAVKGRDSWDPTTAYYAVYGAGPWMYRTCPGTVRVYGDSYTDFIPGEGKHYLLYPARPREDFAAEIDVKVMRLFE